jgi:uncharacterized phage protein (TIGR02220 family)
MIDPNIWQSEDFAKLTNFSKLVFIGLFSNADDHGRGRAKPSYIKSILFPYSDQLRVADIDTALSEIALNMSITFYQHNGNEYYRLDNWADWQKVEKPSESKIPDFDEDSVISRGLVGDKSRLKERKIKEKKRNTSSGADDDGELGPRDLCRQAIAYLNERIGKRYTLTDSYFSHMNARINEGATLDDFKQVVDIKLATWGKAPESGEKDMRKFLRPETLFGTKFQGYLNEHIDGLVLAQGNGQLSLDAPKIINGRVIEK